MMTAIEDAPEEDINEDNMSMKYAKELAQFHKMLVAVCVVCRRPHVWRKGMLEVEPVTCGRDQCMVEYKKVKNDGS